MNNQAESLLSWYDRCRRTLPWREQPEPYHVWVSEIMLQQTRVEAVREYYLRFLETLPDIASLAAADEETVLKLWEGLGYYSRARSLQKAARMVMDSYGGRLPESAAELKKLPGIGEYTSAAIASIAFGERIPAVDGNLLRIYARMTLYRDNIRTPAALRRAQQYFLEDMPAQRPGDYNQALMDLGAGICSAVPRRPECARCPWKTWCAAYREDPSGSAAMALPVMPDKKPRTVLQLTVLLLYTGDRVLLRKRPGKGLLAGLYEFPNLEGEKDSETVIGELRAMGLHPLRIRPAGKARHIFTHREWEMTGYEVWLPEEPVPAGMNAVSREELKNGFPLPSAFAYYLEKIGTAVV